MLKLFNKVIAAQTVPFTGLHLQMGVEEVFMGGKGNEKFCWYRAEDELWNELDRTLPGGLSLLYEVIAAQTVPFTHLHLQMGVEEVFMGGREEMRNSAGAEQKMNFGMN
ncbi:hypothetical protein CEXT_773511 [Caerostris extrusa]|uniref:Uncharacterized protein n=1 Tax=Caerostris extrusa TaxID=172846 RepID=A0AAV4PF34_CAEEX|nr:hypothetical protein CEXT_773511 [Caerostris extrusa]